MSLTGPTKIVSDGTRTADVGRPEVRLPASGPARLRQVADALAADAAAADATGALGGPAMGLSVVRAPDPTSLSDRRAALAAALQEWSGATSGTRRTTALAVLAASRTAKVRQEATRAAQESYEETVFDAFFRGVEGRPRTQRLSGGGDQQ